MDHVTEKAILCLGFGVRVASVSPGFRIPEKLQELIDRARTREDAREAMRLLSRRLQRFAEQNQQFVQGGQGAMLRCFLVGTARLRKESRSFFDPIASIVGFAAKLA